MSVTTGADKPRSYSGDYMDLGRRGEEIVISWLRAHSHILKVEDVREFRFTREIDVDCIVYLDDGRVALAEIKTDSHLGRSGNVLFEVLRLNHTAPSDHAGTLGWSLRSPAKWLLFYAPAVAKIYRVRFEDYRRAWQRYTRERRKLCRYDFVSTDSIKSTFNFLIPWDPYCKSIFAIHDLKAEQLKLVIP